MISVITNFEIESKLSPSVIGASDRSFFLMDDLLQGAKIGDDDYSGVSSEARVSYRPDLVGKITDLETRVSFQGEQRVSGSLDETIMEIDGGGKDLAYIDEENSVSFYDLGGGMHGFRLGDMVWGKVKSHPWWPGHIFNESFASPAVRRMRREGLVLVAFFGDSSYGWFDPAELVPFDPHFSEKSRQTTSRSFVKAVEEALDEASRRSALGLACRCRNTNNFRPTSVTGYFFVDVSGYEPGGIYSSRQIKKTRDSFVPAELISFARQSALDFRNHQDSFEWIQMMARLMAYRKAVFEEFDETYAQAFGVEPSRPSPSNMVAFDQTDRFAHRGAPLSGPLVIAETVFEHKNSAKQNSNKHTNSNRKNKYLLKRRDNLLSPPTISLPNLPFPPPADPLPAPRIDADHPQPAAPPQDLLPTSIPLQKSHLYAQNDIKIPVFDPAMPAKRPRQDEESETKKRRKKKNDSLDAEEHNAVTKSISSQEDCTNIELPQGIDLTSLQLPQIISDLSFIALDPFYAIERNAPAIVRYVFLRFRSIVYQKSLILPSETHSFSQQLSAETGVFNKESNFSSKMTKFDSRLSDKTKSVRKRDPSDRQEDILVKKMEKMTQIKELASKKKMKKTTSFQKNSESKDQKEIISSATSTESGSKKEEAKKVPSPTFLIMKFPPKSTLPSVANLKARFARFGPLDLLGTRVSWKTYSCRVLFKHKSDAQSAIDFVQNNDLFGHFKVIYFLRDQEISAPDLPLDPLTKSSDSSLVDRHGISNIQPPQTQLKSILKKPGNDDSNPNISLPPITIPREIPRVKFMLNGDDDPTPSKPATGSVPSQPQMLPPRPPPPQPRVAPGHFNPSRGPSLSSEPMEKMIVDISGPMLSLLLKCNDIVGNVKSSLGYNPYHYL